MHRHYSYYYRRCRECGRPAVDASEYCELCDRDVAEEDDAQQLADQLENDEREARDADSVPEVSECTCPSFFEPSASLWPSDPRLDRYCPIHGDGGPDPDRLYEERRDQLMEDHLHGYTPDNSED